MQFINTQSPIVLGVFYYVYNIFSPYVTFAFSLITPFVVDTFLLLIQYNRISYTSDVNVKMIMQFVNQHYNSKWALINNTHEPQEQLKSNSLDKNFKCRYGKHILYINGYNFIYLSCDKQQRDVFILAPTKLINHFIEMANTVGFAKQIKTYTPCYELFTASGSSDIISKIPVLCESHLQTSIKIKIADYTNNVFPILYSHSLPTTYSILLHGPPGTGKTTLCNLIAADLRAKMIIFNIADYVSCFKIIKKEFANVTDVNIIAINELDLYYDYQDHFSTKYTKMFIENMHDLLENSGQYLTNNFVIVICTTNNIAAIKEHDPATLSRFKEIIEMPNLNEHEAKDFARNYADVLLKEKKNLLNDKIMDMTATSIREITKYISAHSSEILVDDILNNTQPNTPELKKDI